MRISGMYVLHACGRRSLRLVKRLLLCWVQQRSSWRYRRTKEDVALSRALAWVGHLLVIPLQVPHVQMVTITVIAWPPLAQRLLASRPFAESADYGGSSAAHKVTIDFLTWEPCTQGSGVSACC
jgi:hypothetical protein